MCSPISKNRSIEWIFVCLVCILVGIISAGSLLIPLRFFAVITVGIVVVMISLSFRDKKIPLLFIFTFLLPININKKLFQLYNPDFLAGSTISIYAVDVFLVALYVMWIYRRAHADVKEKVVWLTPVSAPVYLIIFAGFLSLLNVRDFTYSYVGIFIMVRSFLFYFYAVNNIRSYREIKAVIVALALGVMCQFLVGSLEIITGNSLGLIYMGGLKKSFLSVVGAKGVARMGGLMGHPNVLAKYLDFIIPLMLAVSFLRGERFVRWMATVGLFAGVICMFFTISRGGIIAAGFSSMVLFWFIAVKNIRERKFLSRTLILTVLIILASSLFSYKVIERFTSSDAGSANVRLQQLDVAKNIIASHPFVGVGINNYVSAAPSYDNTHHRTSREFKAPIHNAYMLVFCETGILGFAAYLWLVCVILVRGARNMAKTDGFLYFLNAGLFFGFMAYFMHTLADTPLYHNLSFVYFILGFFAVVDLAVNGKREFAAA
jgi:putative inorganic carbon (HCO3(-)) transporter